MAGETEYGGGGFVISYKMPVNINGKYYLVVMADAYSIIPEVNEDNNFYSISAGNSKPLVFENGKIMNISTTQVSRMSINGKRPVPYSNAVTQTLVRLGNLNTYTPAELKTMLIHDKKTGKLDARMKTFRNSPDSKSRIIKKVRR